MSSSQPIICVPKQTHRVLRRTHRLSKRESSVSSLFRNSTLETVFRTFPRALEFYSGKAGSALLTQSGSLSRPERLKALARFRIIQSSDCVQGVSKLHFVSVRQPWSNDRQALGVLYLAYPPCCDDVTDVSIARLGVEIDENTRCNEHGVIFCRVYCAKTAFNTLEMA